MSSVKDKYKYVVKRIEGDKYVDHTFIGLTPQAGRYQGVIYAYGKVYIPEEKQPNPEIFGPLDMK